MPTKLHGILAALVTPMTEAEELDCDALRRFVDYLIAEGVHGLIPLGSTGEYYALSPEERETVVRVTLEAATGRAPVVVGASAGSTREVVAYCRQAHALGADAVMLAAPYYSLPSEDELFEHFRLVAESTELPIVLYNYPGRTGVDMTPGLIARLAELDRIQYVKESSGEVARVGEIIRTCGEKITVLCGCDTAALESFVLGAAGWVGGVVNVLPGGHVELYRLAVEQGDFAAARTHYYRMLPLLSLMEAGGKYTQYVKAGCELTGHPVGPPRRPLLPPTDEETARLRETLREA